MVSSPQNPRLLWTPVRTEDWNPREGNSGHFVPRSGDVVEFSELSELGLDGTVKLLFSFLWPQKYRGQFFSGDKWHPVMSHGKPRACHSEHCLLCSRILEFWMNCCCPPGPPPNKWEADLHKPHFYFIHPLPKSRSGCLISSHCGRSQEFKRHCGQWLEGLGSRVEFLFEIKSWNKRKPGPKYKGKKKQQIS